MPFRRWPLVRPAPVALVVFVLACGCTKAASAPPAHAMGSGATPDPKGSSPSAESSTMGGVNATSPAKGESGVGAQNADASRRSLGDDGERSFQEAVLHVKNTVPSWDNGTGLVAEFVKLATGSTKTLVYVDRTPPEWKPNLRTWFILSRARIGSEVVSTVAVAIRELRPGQFHGEANSKDCLVGAALGTDEWDPTSPSTAWSNNEGGYCDVVLRHADSAGDLEGNLRAKLVSQDGTFFSIRDGYLYINR